MNCGDDDRLPHGALSHDADRHQEGDHAEPAGHGSSDQDSG